MTIVIEPGPLAPRSRRRSPALSADKSLPNRSPGRTPVTGRDFSSLPVHRLVSESAELVRQAVGAMSEPTYFPRHAVRQLLSLLASEDEQLAYERAVPYVDITAELVCMWFDDTYHPDESWSGPFTAEELRVLAAFHSLYKSLLRRLPESRGTVRTWLSCPEWRLVMAAAGQALACVPA